MRRMCNIGPTVEQVRSGNHVFRRRVTEALDERLAVPYNGDFGNLSPAIERLWLVASVIPSGVGLVRERLWDCFGADWRVASDEWRV